MGITIRMNLALTVRSRVGHFMRAGHWTLLSSPFTSPVHSNFDGKVRLNVQIPLTACASSPYSAKDSSIRVGNRWFNGCGSEETAWNMGSAPQRAPINCGP
jgi:hypothetical protein